ncbi:G-protein alpha subunit [Cristinia sonorae]|uniref:G-protein alpha subunit n=1 Tax=Cristinia sonorae TaxID=1940300 RepID=A0A8K0XPT2_9AGAR|nr:G-protein alpha subunit [Cristinia sonorae]
MIHTQRPPSVTGSIDRDDPLTAVLRPAPGESLHERELRLQREAEAKRVSDRIDEQLTLDRERYKKSKQDVRLLLLGQAESGKSTLQKQFQLMYNPGSLEEERISWRAVIYYNITRPVRRIFEALDTFGDGDDDDDDGFNRIIASSSDLAHLSPDLVASGSSSAPSSAEDAQLADLRTRLAPLLSAESSLAERLSGGLNVAGSGKGNVYVRSGWQARSLGISFGRARSRGDVMNVSSEQRTSLDRIAESDALIEEVARMVDQLKDDVKTLWQHPAVRRLRSRRKLRLEEWAEFFMDNITRVCSSGYVPTTDDILHARIQTMGVAEHVFDMAVHGRVVTWHLFDVGGARGQRHTWIPYFDDANAIIFLAPVSAYDQYLDEDPRTNRIDDSLQLFTQICSNPLLKKVHLVLFLNKTDVLQQKLSRGIRVKKYITSYGDRPQEFDSVVNYFKTHFTQVHKRNNENKRVLYTHLTNVVDTKATKNIITNVSDSIFRKYLEDAALV